MKNHWPIDKQALFLANNWLTQVCRAICESRGLTLGELLSKSAREPVIIGRRSLVCSTLTAWAQKINASQKTIGLLELKGDDYFDFAPPGHNDGAWTRISTATVGRLCGVDHVTVRNALRGKGDFEVYFNGQWVPAWRWDEWRKGGPAELGPAD